MKKTLLLILLIPTFLFCQDINKLQNKKLNDLMEKKMSAMLKNQLPIILDNYFKNKK